MSETKPYNEQTSVVVLGGTSLRLLLGLEDSLKMIREIALRNPLNWEQMQWVAKQENYVNKLRETNPRS